MVVEPASYDRYRLRLQDGICPNCNTRPSPCPSCGDPCCRCTTPWSQATRRHFRADGTAYTLDPVLATRLREDAFRHARSWL